MAKIAVEIEWDWPDEPEWLNADNVAVALHAHCKNTKFVVRDVEAYEIDLGEDFSFLPCAVKDDEILIKKVTEGNDYESLCQRLPERVVSEIHQAIGRASACWENLDSTAGFDSEQASSIASALCNFIADFWEETGPEEAAE